MVHYFNAGGFLMYPLLGLFIIGLAFTIVKFWLLMRANINSERFFNSIIKNPRERRHQEGHRCL